jgi:general stress protein YciG
VSTHDRGFASMNRDKQREIASKGGRAAHAKGRAHEWTKDEAREAGRKGGMASQRAKREEQRQTPWPGIVPTELPQTNPAGTHI